MLLDLDAFFASVEQLDHPDWRGKPVIVGGDPKRRGVVSTCSYEARRYGVRSAMPSATAARLCPEAIWTAGNFSRYYEMSEQVMKIMQDVSPRIQQVSIDEAFLDISPGRFVRDYPVELAERISGAVAELGITCSIGLGSSKTIAKIASDIDKPSGLTVVYPGSEAVFLAPLPVRALSGIGPQSAARLKQFGIATLGQLAQADAALLREVFGKQSESIRQHCLGLDDSQVLADETVKSVSNEMTFNQDLVDYQEISAAIAMMAAKVGRRLRHRELAGYTVTLKLRYADLSIRTAQRTLIEPQDDEQLFTPIAIELLTQIWRPGDEVRLVGVGISGFIDDRPVQLSLLDSLADETSKALLPGEVDAAHSQRPVRQSKRSLVQATDKVRDRFGEKALGYGRDLRFLSRDTGTIGQKKDDYQDPPSVDRD
jgi:DNA polymerase-4